MKKQLRFVATCLAALLLLSGCSNANESVNTAADTPAEGVDTTAVGAHTLQRDEPQYGGELVVGHRAGIDNLDPAASSANGAIVMRAIFDSLFVYDEDANVIPELAESIETDDGGLTWTMTLPAGVKFHDETDFNASAVVAHLERLAAEGSQSRSAGDVRAIADMQVPDEQTVVFTLEEPNILFPRLFVWGQPGGPGMIPSPTAVEEYGDEIASHPVGVGPFMLDSFQVGSQAVLVKNPDYRIDDQPYLDTLTFVAATDSQSKLSATIAGDLDMASTQSGTDLVEAEEGGLVALPQPLGTYYNMLFNLAEAPFDDVRFREAVMRAIDLEALDQAAFDGLHERMQGVLPSTNPFFKETDWPDFDPERAAELVEEYTSDTGNAPEFELITTSPPEFQRQATIIQEMLADAGITVNLTTSDQPGMVTSALAGNYEAQLRFADVREEVIQSIRTGYHSDSAGNNGQAGNPELDAILDELTVVEDAEERTELLAEAQNIFADWLPIAPLIAHSNGWYVGDEVGGFPGVRVGIDEPDWRLVWANQD